MAFESIPFTASPALKQELEFFASTEEGTKIYSGIHSPQDVVHWIENNPDFLDLKWIVVQLPRAKILDVGVGWGLTTAYLAIHGFDVTCVEPSQESCENMKAFFSRLQLKITIIRGIAEAIDHLKDDFGAIIFWSSLHHCDDPVQALKNSYERLVPDGQIILFEPVLRFYRTKAWFYRMMKVDPQKVGHYGGNEHIYRYQEYVEFLKESGFNRIVSKPSQRYFSKPKRAVWDRRARWVLKRLYYWITGMVAGDRFIVGPVLTKLSMMMPVVIARKDRASLA